MPKILHTARYTGEPWEILKSVVPSGFTVETLEELSYDCLLSQAVDADYLLVSGRLPIDEGILSVAKHLKMIQRTGVGTEMLDLEAIKRHEIPIYVNGGINARSVAEHTLTLMLCCLKNIPQIDKQVKSGIWKKQQTGVVCKELYGKTVGLVGMGAIGRLVATYLKAFRAKTIYTDLFRLSEEQEGDLCLTYVPSFEEILHQVDILSFHCPLTLENKGMLDADAIKKMKDGAIIVNTARGKLIEPKAIFEALSNGKLRTVALDVHYEEPIQKEYELSKLDNVILTPHIAGLTYEAFHSMMAGAVENIVSFENHNLSQIKDKRIV
ncbi:MAG: 2-hydroxyacid dehydrogenase [Prevotella sp.]|nr:2-hydroxyacid dehydrogenase [Prevotella sp.]